MKATIYLKKKKSGNYEISNKKEHTHKFRTKAALEIFFQNLSKETTSTWDSFNRCFKKAQVIKATYSQVQTYFSSAKELLTSIDKEIAAKKQAENKVVKLLKEKTKLAVKKVCAIEKVSISGDNKFLQVWKNSGAKHPAPVEVLVVKQNSGLTWKEFVKSI